MRSFVAKVSHFREELPFLRLGDGTLIPPDASFIDLDLHVDDVLINIDGTWYNGTDEDWTEKERIGVVTTIEPEKVIVQADGGLVSLTVPEGMELKKDYTVRFNEQNRVRSVAATTPVRAAPIELDRDDGFDAATVRTTPDPALSWEQFAGFPDIIAEARELTATQLNAQARAQLAAMRVPQLRGLVFAGPPGTGKTHLAQIMAARSGAALYLVTAASLGGRLVGESEGRLEAIYADASKQDLSIVFIDEIDVMTKSRDSEYDSASRLVNVFLTNMDGGTTRTNVVTIGTTNRVDEIDRALRRPGRFDREITFRHPDGSDRLAILRAREPDTAGTLDDEYVAANTDGWSAADLQSVWQHAGELAVTAGRTSIHNDHFLIGFERARSMWNARQENT
jgi:transitional endoplasmic reticulum ATPase